MATRQTRIFVPPAPPYEDAAWQPTLVGSLLAALVAQPPALEWYWFSQYVASRDDSGDCDIAVVPQHFGVGPQGYFRSLRFRCQIADEDANGFEELATSLIRRQGCVISDFRDYPWVEDLGGDRFFGGADTVELRTRRASYVADFLFRLCALYVDCLVGPDARGHFSLEATRSDQNPQDSPFESVHHLFCNITNVPTRVLVCESAVGTDYSPPSVPQGGRVVAFRVRF